MGVFEKSGQWLATLDDFSTALKQKQSQVCDVGTMDTMSTLVDPANGDFRLNKESVAVDRGSIAFIPWALYGVVAEWNFYPAGNDPATILDEHWYANEYLSARETYHRRPTYPLTVINGTAADYQSGPLENYINGALVLDPTRHVYAMVSNATLATPYSVKLNKRSNHGQDPLPEQVKFEGEALKTPEIYTGNFLVEVFFKATSDGLLISKIKGAGYSLHLDGGKAVFQVVDQDDTRCRIVSTAKLDNNRWHHLVAEADRIAKTLTLYVDGKMDATGAGLGSVSLANEGDLFVGGTPDGDWLDGTFEFMRIAHGTLADSRTTIEELLEWQFNGPALRDMRGSASKGRGRDAGALERE